MASGSPASRRRCAAPPAIASRRRRDRPTEVETSARTADGRGTGDAHHRRGHEALRRPPGARRRGVLGRQRPTDRLRSAATAPAKTTTMRILLGVLQADSRAGRSTAARSGDRPPPLRLHARGARALPEDAGRRADPPTWRVCTASTSGPPGSARPHCSNASTSRSTRATPSKALSWATSSGCRSPRHSSTDPEVLVLDNRSRAWTRMRSTPCSACSVSRRQACRWQFSSHQLDVVERLCDDVVVIADGTSAPPAPRRTSPQRRTRRVGTARRR